MALYRAYRPQTFKEVAGQKPIIQTLKNAIKLNKVAHAYLFAGPRGTGKTTMAKIMAKALNCEHGPTDDPCNECEICKGITKGTIPDVIEIDAASNNGVDEIRELRDNVKYLPSVCKYKVYIIDEVHMLSQGAFNALLKTLEEPPAHVIFILATTEPHKIPATILSRCQRFDFQAVRENDMIERLNTVCKEEKIKITDEAIQLVASFSEGGMRDALSLLDESISYSTKDIIDEADVLAVSGNVSDLNILNLLREVENNESAKALDILNKILDEGKEISKVISDIMTFLRNVLLFKINKITSTKEIYKQDEYISFANRISTNLVYKYLNLLNDCLNDIKYTNQKRAFLEICIIKMSDKSAVVDIDSLMRRIDSLERTIENLKNQPITQQTNMINEPMFSNITPFDEIDRNIEFDYSKCISTADVNVVLNNGDKELKLTVNNMLPKLVENYNLLEGIKTMAVSKKTAIFTLSTVGTCNRMMKDPNYTNILNFFKELGLKEVFFIDKKNSDEILQDFLSKFKAGDKSPILDNHDIRILKYVKTKEVSESSDGLDDLFDSDLIEEE
ncbi:MAG: DNA polymerase III subunit gamma/tau [Acholeplasmatales bacterium]|nr:DNA polymerase III subunit gamma/tau [Acholeplasmatales bacterium]